MAPVVSALAAVKVPMGTYVVLGNNDYEACYADIVRQLEAHNIHLLEHRVDTLKQDGAEILIAGVRNPLICRRMVYLLRSPFHLMIS